jgi:large subunit ribosomal protein L23
MKKPASHILLTPRITEKGAYLSEAGGYIFHVAKDANKFQIAQAVKEIFNVTPRKVRVMPIPRKERLTRGTNRMGKSAGGKKAYVYLKKGESIELT